MSSEVRFQLVCVLVGAVLTTAFVFVRRWFIRRQFARRHGCEPLAASLSRDPFLGLDLIPATIRGLREHKMLEMGCKYYRTYGNTFAAQELFSYLILTTEPQNIKTILSTRFKDYGIGYRLQAFKPLLGAGIFDTDGDHWASSRALLRPNFTRDQVADLTSFENLIQDLFSLLPRDGQTVVDLQDLFFRYTIDSSTEFLFGQSVGSLKKDQSELNFAEAFNHAQRAIVVRATLGPLRFLYRDKRADKCERICRDFAQQFVEQALYAVESGKDGIGNKQSDTERQKYVFSHQLAWRTSDKRRILDELMNVLLAGRDTTASLLSNLFFMLAKYPAVWDKVRREIAGLQGRAPTYEELRGFKYVQYCINESLRLHPVVPRNQREAIRDTVLPVGGGKDGLSPVFVPAGTRVCYDVYAMHRRRDFYGPDADTFRPERWESGRLQPRWEYLPFNGGPRICLGQQYALTEVAYVVVRMAQEFRVLKSRDPGPNGQSSTSTAQPIGVLATPSRKICIEFRNDFAMKDGFAKTWPRRLLQLEGACVFGTTIWAYSRSRQSWWTFAALLLTPDLGMAGYLANTSAGAVLYNTFHTETPPILLLCVAMARDNKALAGVALSWLAHIGMDRMLGYGLKYGSSFSHTHLGDLGFSGTSDDKTSTSQ